MVKISIKYDNWESLESIKKRLFEEYEEDDTNVITLEDITDDDVIEFFKYEVWQEIMDIAETARHGDEDSEQYVEIHKFEWCDGCAHTSLTIKDEPCNECKEADIFVEVFK